MVARPVSKLPVIIAIDDNPKELELVRLAVHMLPYPVEILTATDGNIGLDLVTSHRDRLRVVVLDVHIGQYSGRQLYPQIRRLAPAAKVIPFTGDREAGADLLALGAYPPIFKPASIDDLIEGITSVFNLE